MRVGLVCYGIERPLSGTTRVAVQLGKALGAARSDCEMVYLTPYRSGPFRDAGYHSSYLPGCNLLPGLMLLGGPLVALAARRLRLDVIHDPVGVSPFTLGRWAGKFKRITHVHDAIAFRYPEGYPWLNNLLHRRYVPATLPHVDAVITVSGHAKSELGRFLRWDQERTFVVPHGVDERFRPLPAVQTERVTARYGLPGPYVLSVGSQQARKNLPRLIEAFAHVRRDFPEHRLAIAGPSQWGYETARDTAARLELSNFITFLGHVREADLPAIYAAADAFAFPSLYEGFGLPVLEAMACGTPVVTSSTTSLPEVAGEAAILVDPADTRAIADGIARVLEPDVAARLRALGRERARQFTWDEAARRTIDVYRRALEGDTEGDG